MKKYLCMLLSMSCLYATPLHAEDKKQVIFDTPESAALALDSAAKKEPPLDLTDLFGKEGKSLLSSGDPVADRHELDLFIGAFKKGHKIKLDSTGTIATILVGPSDWPLPVPLVKGDRGWQFDASAGEQELGFRRIGRNELNAMQVVLAYTDAQRDYSQLMRSETGRAFYAQHLISTAGTHDGLYWQTRADEQQSPLGELAARASSEGYKKGEGRMPFQGYYYKILTRQGAAAPGGEIDYIANGEMIGGYGLLAWPASYRKSGVMSFIVNHDGTIYERDLGEKTDEKVEQITSFNPEKGWLVIHESSQ